VGKDSMSFSRAFFASFYERVFTGAFTGGLLRQDFYERASTTVLYEGFYERGLHVSFCEFLWQFLRQFYR